MWYIAFSKVGSFQPFPLFSLGTKFDVGVFGIQNSISITLFRAQALEIYALGVTGETPKIKITQKGFKYS